MSWELAVIGTAIASPASIDEAGDLRPFDFSGENVPVWSEILLAKERGALDARTVIEALRSSPAFQQVSRRSPEEYVAEAITYRGNSMEEYANHVIEASIKRSVLRSAALIAAEAQNNQRTAEDLMVFAEDQLLSLRRTRGNEGVTMQDLMSAMTGRIDGIRSGQINPAWVPEITAMRTILDWVEEKDFVILAGRPGEGKSQMLRFELFHHVLRRNGKALVFNLENDEQEYARHFISLDTGIDSAKIKNPRLLNTEELEQVRQSARHLAQMPIRIVTLGSPSVSRITSIAKKAIMKEGYDLVGVDYVQLLSNGIENRVNDVTLSSQGLRALAMNAGVPVIANAQLSRDIEKRGVEAEPVLSDLRDSGSLEQDATIIGFIRNQWSNPTPEQIRMFPENVVRGTVLPRPVAVPIKVFVRKNRNGTVGVTDTIKWIKSTGRFQSLVRA